MIHLTQYSIEAILPTTSRRIITFIRYLLFFIEGLQEAFKVQRFIISQCFHFIPSETTRKAEVFWCFEGLANGSIGQKWFKRCEKFYILSF